MSEPATLEPIVETLPNGLTVLVERMPAVKSAAFSLSVPLGGAYDPPGRSGTAAILAEMMFRGAGEYDSRALSSALDDLGVHLSAPAGTLRTAFSGATVARNVPDALRLLAAIVREPHLPGKEFEPARESVALTLRSLEDEPQQKLFTELRRRTYDHPWGSPADGRLSDLPQIDVGTVRELYADCVRPNDCILSVAGDVDPQAIIDLATDLFGDWELKVAPEIETVTGSPAVEHLHFESEQTQIGIAYASVPYRHPDYLQAWATVSVLSGGMSSRLFSEVREKRGLCYSVYAAHHSLRSDARVLCYAGTLAERAQETLDVMIGELQKLSAGVTETELDRVRVRAKSSLVMQQESTLRRAASLNHNWFHLGRVRSLAEITEQVEALSVDSLRAFAFEHPARAFTIVTIGPAPLDVPDE